VMTAEVARRHETQDGWAVAETRPGAFRRVVPSPRPRLIIESDHIRSLMQSGAVVIAAGGGGIPVVRQDGSWHSVDAVIDKDRASALLAATAGVDTLVLVTGVDEVYVGYGTAHQRALRDVRPEELRAHLEAGEFPPGSMGPKVESALQFVADGGSHAVITSLPRLREALQGRNGTHLVKAPR
jgi:carbamate kinase